MLNHEQCLNIHRANAGRRCWLEPLAANDHRLVLCNARGPLTIWTGSEYDTEEQAQAARLCASLNGNADAVETLDLRLLPLGPGPLEVRDNPDTMCRELRVDGELLVSVAAKLLPTCVGAGCWTAPWLGGALRLYAGAAVFHGSDDGATVPQPKE